MRKSIVIMMLLVGAIVFAGGVSHAVAQDVEDPTHCPFCKTTGKITNPFYESTMEREKDILFCSWESGGRDEP